MLISVLGLIMGWFLTLFSHNIEDNDILFLIWDFLLSLQIRVNKDLTPNVTHLSIDNKVNSKMNSNKYLSLTDNSINNGSFTSLKDEQKVVPGCLCEFLVAQIIVFHLKGHEIDNELTEDELLMVIKQIDLNALNILDYRVIISKTRKLIELFDQEIF